MVWVYSEDDLGDRLSGLSPNARTTFAVACATLLLHYYWALEARLGIAHDGSETLARALQACQGERGDGLDAVRPWIALVEPLIPDEDGEWVWESGLAQNSAIGVVHALNTRITGSVQDAVWAARQVFEAVDYLSQFDVPSGQPSKYVQIYDEQRPELYRLMVAQIDSILRVVETGTS